MSATQTTEKQEIEHPQRWRLPSSAIEKLVVQHLINRSRSTHSRLKQSIGERTFK